MDGGEGTAAGLIEDAATGAQTFETPLGDSFVSRPPVHSAGGDLLPALPTASVGDEIGSQRCGALNRARILKPQFETGAAGVDQKT